MTPDIVLSLIILGIAIILFISERIRVDLVALIVLVSLSVSGLISPSEALSGFSSPAVVTIWAVLILSGGLTQTGVANLVGEQILRIAGNGESKLIIIIMLTAGLLSGFMNNIAVAAMLLPVVIKIAKQTHRAPSKLLIPLAFGSLLGGMSTLIGTPPNILASEALVEFGLNPYSFFDFFPMGIIVLVTGTLFMAFFGRHLLPERYPTK
ncbi:MAG: SLC13 family permease, partial [Chloroflexota bacterium]